MQRRAVEHRRLIRQRHRIDAVGPGRDLSPVLDEVAGHPFLHPRRSRRPERQAVGGERRREGPEGIAVEPRPAAQRHAVARDRAEGVEDVAPQAAVDIRRAVLPGQPVYQRGIVEIHRAARAEIGREALVHPLMRGHTLEQRIDVAGERDLGGGRRPAGLFPELGEQVQHGAPADQVAGVVRWRDHHPGALAGHGVAVDADARGHRPVAGLVVPAGGVAEGVRLGGDIDRQPGRRARDAEPAQHPQPPRGIGVQLADHRVGGLALVGEGAVQLLLGARAGDRVRPRVDGQVGALLDRVVGVAPLEREIRRRRQVHRGAQLVPAGLAGGEMRGPGDLGVGGGELGHHVALAVIAVDAELRRLALQQAIRMRAAGRRGGGRQHLRPDVILPCIAHAGDPEAGVDGGAYDGSGHVRLLLLTGSWMVVAAGLASGRTCAAEESCARQAARVRDRTGRRYGGIWSPQAFTPPLSAGLTTCDT